MSGAISDLISCDVANSGLYLNEGREFLPSTEDFGPEFKKYLQKNPTFLRIWQGGPDELHIILRKQIDVDEKGKIIYNGKVYNKDAWCCYYWGDCLVYGPPKVIRQQGRMAKEYPDAANTHPVIFLRTAQGQIIELDACPCGGELIMDDDNSLYCKECGEVYK